MNRDQKRVVKKIIHDNDYNTRFGKYAQIPHPTGERNSYCNNVKTGAINHICNVAVINRHQYEILESLVEKKGVQFLNQYKIALVQTIGDKFINNASDSLEGLRDMQFIVRTNFAGIHNASQRKELRKLECMYYSMITNIRNPDMSDCNYYQVFPFSLFLTIPLSGPDLIHHDKMLSKHDFITSLQKLEIIFQTAMVRFNRTLVFSPYGIDEIDGLPVDDVIKMFNRCIMKYGHKFDNIILAIPPQYGEKTFKKFNNKIIKPQVLTSEVDDKFESKKSHFKLKNLQDIQEME